MLSLSKGKTSNAREVWKIKVEQSRCNDACKTSQPAKKKNESQWESMCLYLISTIFFIEIVQALSEDL